MPPAVPNTTRKCTFLRSQLTPMGGTEGVLDVLANELRERILSGDYVEGTPLPPERELVVQTKMSRTTVREALRILEVQGLVHQKAGRAGGAFVQRPGEQSMADTVALLIRGRQIRLAPHRSRPARRSNRSAHNSPPAIAPTRISPDWTPPTTTSPEQANSTTSFRRTSIGTSPSAMPATTNCCQV